MALLQRRSRSRKESGMHVLMTLVLLSVGFFTGYLVAISVADPRRFASSGVRGSRLYW